MLTLTLNAALDVTYRVDELIVGQSHRVEAVSSRAGGKGVNVARVLRQLGRKVVVSGLVAGEVGEGIRADVVGAGMTEAFVSAEGESRRTVTIVDARGATAFNESGAAMTLPDWTSAERKMRSLMKGSNVIVASGSLPPCAPEDAYANLTEAAHSHGGRIIVDASGPALLHAARAGADVLKPNAGELLESTGCTSVDDGVDALLDLGAGAVAASLGAEGLIVRSRSGSVRARPIRGVSGNATGAGDAVVAALAIALDSGWTLAESALFAVSLSAAAVAHPLAGSFDADVFGERLAELDDDGMHTTQLLAVAAGDEQGERR
ncbi:1-phosphofructokinase family hexose kinase [Agromyces aerolatus]|uniref:1-phosphofructokinase family hexose kinase n=1 Tax=Agromyces sp. LY-1074 TaxID=3074080 RepID=UPI0028668192|nr:MULTISPECIES: hexose kinase [unclassified Agromyces]MDR5700486.1 hexose kinase [Agromyces sp. LY-1074]MDR5707007.1 hexose kinase [Agromyces sp. LY-1358]